MAPAAELAQPLPIIPADLNIQPDSTGVPLRFPIEYFIERHDSIEMAKHLLNLHGHFDGILLRTEESREYKTRCKVLDYRNGEFSAELPDSSIDWHHENDILLPGELHSPDYIKNNAYCLALDFEREIIKRQVSRMLEPLLKSSIPDFQGFWEMRFLSDNSPPGKNSPI